MGKPVKILDLAQRMIKLSGLEIDKDIQVKFTGLRPGEKLYEELITTKSWWDTVDGLAANQVGEHFQRYPELRGKCTKRWMASGNIWLQRTCLIFQLRYKKQTDFELMKSFIIPLAGSKEFFIRKAIGWALRQYSKFEPARVIDFVESQPMSHLSKKEALKLIK